MKCNPSSHHTHTSDKHELLGEVVINAGKLLADPAEGDLNGYRFEHRSDTERHNLLERHQSRAVIQTRELREEDDRNSKNSRNSKKGSLLRFGRGSDRGGSRGSRNNSNHRKSSRLGRVSRLGSDNGEYGRGLEPLHESRGGESELRVLQLTFRCRCLRVFDAFPLPSSSFFLPLLHLCLRVCFPSGISLTGASIVPVTRWYDHRYATTEAMKRGGGKTGKGRVEEKGNLGEKRNPNPNR